MTWAELADALVVHLIPLVQSQLPATVPLSSRSHVHQSRSSFLLSCPSLRLPFADSHCAVCKRPLHRTLASFSGPVPPTPTRSSTSRKLITFLASDALRTLSGFYSPPNPFIVLHFNTPCLRSSCIRNDLHSRFRFLVAPSEYASFPYQCHYHDSALNDSRQTLPRRRYN